MLGSHLQKYKMRIQKRYNLTSFDDIKNHMVPEEFDSGATKLAARQWEIPGFNGFAAEEVTKWIAQNE